MDLDFSDLSEDWVPQPRSSDLPEVKDDSVLRRSASVSRIPLPKRQSTSSISRKHRDSALTEKTASALNTEAGPGSPAFDGGSVIWKEPEEGQVGTIQRGEQQAGIGAKQLTPEWRRRLLNSKGKLGNQHDLFAPNGLERIFKPPTVRDQSPPKARKRGIMPASSVPPSSPPPLPRRNLQLQAPPTSDDSVQLPRYSSLPRIRSVNAPGSHRSRISSRKSDSRHEDFSPVQIGERFAVSEGAEADKGSHSGQDQANNQVEATRPSSSMSDSALELGKAEVRGSRQDPDVTSLSLPDESELESDAFAHNGAFVTTRRGGFSADGSFHARPLSPSSFQPQSEPQLPKFAVSVTEPPDRPLTPEPPGKTTPADQGSTQPQRSSGSPLKLFAKYDTFTNDRLSRRISQFEEGRSRSSDNVLDEAEEPSTPSPIRRQQRKKRMSSFGDGELDKFNFSDDYEPQDVPKWPNKEQEITTKLPSQGQSGQAQTHIFSKQFRKATFFHNVTLAKERIDTQVQDDEQIDHKMDGKRLRSSPQKAPDAKRRRTIGEEAEPSPEIRLPKQRPEANRVNSMAGKKRKDARYDNFSQTADPEIIAGRQMLQPKLRQRSVAQPSRMFSMARITGNELAEERLIDVDAATDVLAGELANLALNVAENMSQGMRKKSVTTADFFREANIIMQNIRSKAAKQNGATSVLASDINQLPEIQESVAEMYSYDDLDRPASREGSPKRKSGMVKEYHRVISRLRKFEDTDDIGLAFNSSFQGLQVRNVNEEHSSESLESEPANIRIRDPPRREDSKSAKVKVETRYASQDKDQAHTGLTYPSSKSSSNRSVPTGSSGTHTKANIAPDKVSHLITDNMGRMTFDHEKQCWVKRRSLDARTGAAEKLASELTEDDPFREIPDLAVDESQELRVARSGTGSRPTSKSSAESWLAVRPIQTSVPSNPTASATESSQVTEHTRSTPTPSTADALAPGGHEETDLEEVEVRPKMNERKDAEAERKLLDGRAVRVEQVKPSAKQRQARVVTVAFSSPLVQPLTPDSEPELNPEAICKPMRPISPDTDDKNQNSSTRIFRKFYGRDHLSSSLVKYTRMQRPLSRIDEGDQSIILAEKYDCVEPEQGPVLATPRGVPERNESSLLVPTTARSYMPMHLTPLSDFTVHHTDESLNLDVQYIARRRGLVSAQEVEGKFSISIKELVEKIADVEPYEPYWEYLRNLDLQDRGLITLHMLDDFCTRIEELNVSGNELGQLNGAPQGLRILNVRNNCLSSLTAWGHLRNLQYLDVSNNEIDSLNGFSDLVHLRELNAEGNSIRGLEGVLNLNGLIKLKLGNNKIMQLNFNESELCRLEELDVHGNEVESMKGLEKLVVLEHLSLRQNQLCEVVFEVQALKFLDVSMNQLTSLDVSQLSSLKDLLIDHNTISIVDGLQDRVDVERISWRCQNSLRERDNESSMIIDFECCSEARLLNLSGTRLPNFNIGESFFRLERLELSSCGLNQLMDDFGIHVPNVRYLNLNYNAVKDIRPLLGIQKLSELHIAGNRVNRFRRSMEVVSKLGEHLVLLDCRNNPITQGFYPAPQSENTTQMVLKDKESSNQADPFDSTVYLVPDAEGEADEQYLQQLDWGTSIRRRVYELMLVKGSGRLEKLDGLHVDRDRILERDDVWDRLVELGVVQLGASQDGQ